MAEYVIELKSNSISGEYWRGGRYFFQGEPYAMLGNASEAKYFSSKKMAQRSADSLNKRMCQAGVFTVVEVEGKNG